MQPGPGKQYLGDGAYVDFDGFGLVLTTEDGISVTNRIYLEPSVYSALITYVDQLKTSGICHGSKPDVCGCGKPLTGQVCEPCDDDHARREEKS